ncbi:5'-flap endonuclease [Aspergillus viridinutans]|uniref:Structure-specific endonuclease subunit SLX4 n=1 Tax=Aspergillus viridinutans TaxID=75553 RepID=A0A9P3BRF4_ASPVI|nr:5'-flap endonuclease [Aspergillus viridinutans]GIJ99237.1 5'-flap endonuclease [Aspergillus viridinutans]
MTVSLETIHLPHLPSALPIHIALYRDVKNSPFLRQQLLSGNGDFEYAFIDASMVISRTHILSAIFRAVNDYLNGRLKSRNVHSEIVFSLSPTNNIADSFRKFGITDLTTDLLVVKVSVTPDVTHDSVAAHLQQSIEGSPVPFADETLSEISDVSKIKKAYKLGALGAQDDEKRRLELSLIGYGPSPQIPFATMYTATDIIVLSSSPDQIPSHSPAEPKCDPEKVFGLSPVSSSPSPLRSPSEPFQPPMRSRFFKTQAGNDGSSRTAKEESETSKDLAASRRKTAARGGRQIRAKEQSTNEAQTLFGHSEPPIPKHDECTSKKGTGSKKKRTDAANKRTTSKNKTITGKVAKSGITETAQSEDKTKEPVTSDVLPGKSSANKLELEKDGLQLEVAMKRRLDWTPTKDTGKRAVGLDDIDDDKTRFGSLLSEYGFLKAATDSQGDLKHSDGGAPTKRRRLELVDTRNPSNTTRTSPEVESNRSNVCSTRSSKASAGERKPRKRGRKITTLTGRVTALYTNDSTDHLDAADTMMRASEDVTNSVLSEGKLFSRSLDIDSCVLPPEDAVNYLKDQDLMFGTCSQLEREDSPTMLRDMQKAIRASEKNMIENSTTRAVSGLYSHTAVSRFQTPRDLWSVAARDMDGSLAEIEVLDMVDISDISELPPRPGGELQVRTDKDEENTAPQGKPRPVEITDEVEAGVDIYAENLTTSESKSEETACRASEIRPMPRFTDWNDSDLSREVRLYGFKPMKSRRKMIEVLEKCWKAQHVSTPTVVQDVTGKPDDGSPGKAGTIQSQTNKQTSTTDAAKKAKKESACLTEEAKPNTALEDKPSHTADESSQALTKSSFADVEEIEDSEDELIPSPSRLQSRYKRHMSESRSSQPLPVSAMPSSPTRTNADSGTKPSPSDSVAESSLPDLASQITKAVRLQPRSFSVGCKRPSWHEKILMYDPIVLEDFATWLNVEGLGLVHEDREVSAEFVRQWCESNGICCGFRKNSRRSER